MNNVITQTQIHQILAHLRHDQAILGSIPQYLHHIQVCFANPDIRKSIVIKKTVRRIKPATV